MFLEASIASYCKYCKQRKQQLESTIASMPEGSLRIAKCRKYFTWRVWNSDGGNRYLPKSQEEFAIALARKSVYEAELHDLKADIEACERYLRYKSSSKSATDQLFQEASPEFRRLLGKTFQTKEEKVIYWENQPYEKSAKYPDELVVPTLKSGEMVRSKLEAGAADCLFTLGIPYKYEKLTPIGAWKIAVDFTALDVRTFREIPIELFGMMDNTEYVQNCQKKLANYITNGFIPGINMITLYESPSMQLGPQQIRKTFEDFFINNPPVQFKISK